ncbi:DNA replication regulator sld2 [Exophiala dermatitidis]
MDDTIPLLDTPKRKTIQSQADALRASLKDFERNFAAANNGRKPGKEDIKADATIAAKYKEYNKVRDVLAGKLSLDALNAPPAPPPPHQSRRRHTRTDSAISLTPRRPRNGNGTKDTPSKARLHPNEIDPYDAPPSSASPKVILSAIGPTPRRDGTVLGIFDLLPRSGSTVKTTISQETPGSRKRKIDALVEAPQDENKNPNLTIAQTPSQRRRSSRTMGDVAQEPLPTTTATPRSCLNTGRRLQHSKTPVSEGKKFMLNHFFATPSAVRFATMIHDDTEEPDHDVAGTPAKTPLRDTVLGLSPSSKHDTTPPYLKRSFSFKERLLSASTSAGSTTISSSSLKHAGVTSPTASRAGPRTLRQAKFGPKPLSQMIAELQCQNESQNQKQNQGAEQVYHDDQEDDDDLEALRELESNEVNVLIGASQVGANGNQADYSLNLEPVRTYKKKGQKRTTRRVIMRPVRMKPAAAPKFVAADDEEDDDDENEDPLAVSSEHGDHRNRSHVSRVAETQIVSTGVSQSEPVSAEDPDFDYLISQAEQEGGDYIDTEDEYLPEEQEEGEDLDQASATPGRKGSSSTISKAKSTVKGKKASSNNSNKKGSADTDGQAGTTRTIDPNAYSHMNFRSLKIKNKNSKAKGRGRFGRGRR